MDELRPIFRYTLYTKYDKVSVTKVKITGYEKWKTCYEQCYRYRDTDTNATRFIKIDKMDTVLNNVLYSYRDDDRYAMSLLLNKIHNDIVKLKSALEDKQHLYELVDAYSKQRCVPERKESNE